MPMKKIDWVSLNQESQKNLLQRPANKLHDPSFVRQVKTIIRSVRTQGDSAVLKYTKKYDRAVMTDFKVSEDELRRAIKSISPRLRRSIEFAVDNIKRYHAAQLPSVLSINTTKGVVCERQPRGIQRVGLYVPGGSAPLISTVMMLAIPANLAGCNVRILCTPPDQNGDVNSVLLATAMMCGIDTIYKVGGVQGIAGMAYGTETIPKVDKIFGPGNAWVTQAKLLVSQDSDGAAIDLPAGPSELLVIADANANPQYVAADLLSQAEHGVDSQVFLVTDSMVLADKVKRVLNLQLKKLSRLDIIEKSLSKGAIILVKDLGQAITLSNLYAPEHLILQVANAQALVADVQSAAAIFVGPWAAETVGDYVSGSNHVLPTYGYARNYSGLSVTDFMKFINVQYISKEGLKNVGEHAEMLSNLEGLTAHKEAISIRLKSLKELSYE